MTRREWLEKRYRSEKERDVRFSTVSDMEVEPLYAAEDLPADARERIGLPGEFPYTRGVYPSMYPSAAFGLRVHVLVPEDWLTVARRMVDRRRRARPKRVVPLRPRRRVG